MDATSWQYLRLRLDATSETVLPRADVAMCGGVVCSGNAIARPAALQSCGALHFCSTVLEGSHTAYCTAIFDLARIVTR